MAVALDDLRRLGSGKVRDIYDLGRSSEGDAHPEVLLVCSDRVSTYDCVHPTPVPDKGAVLTALSAFWFERTADLVAGHVLSVTDGVPSEARGRGMVVRRLRMLPIECVVRGYLAGSGWRDYEATGAVSGVALPPGLLESAKLPEPIFTPSTKATEGHDEPISFAAAVELLGDRSLAERVREAALAVFARAAAHARACGILLADTKFEFGLDAAGVLTLGDELCTPDSSRFWPLEDYAPGRPEPSFDKQFVRDWATSTGWDRRPPAPAIPDEIIDRTRERYLEAYARLSGEPLAAWLGRTDADASADAGPGG